MSSQPDPTLILQTATGFWASKVLLTAVQLDLFSVLSDGSMTAEELGDALGLHPRSTYDFLDALVALGFMNRDGDGPEGKYRNTAEARAFLDAKSATYIGGFPKMLDSRLYSFWGDLEAGLKSGKPQNESKYGGRPMFEAVYDDEESLAEFLASMSGLQAANFEQLAQKFDFSKYQTVSDIGGALALLSRTLGARHEHLRFNTFDLPKVARHAQKQVDAAGMTGRINVVSGNFFEDELPRADVITMGNILHDWNLETKKILIGKAYEALPNGGAFIAIENVIDDARRENVFGLLMSLNMLIEFGDAADYTGADFREWCRETGFRAFDLLPLAGPSSAAIAYK